MCLWLSISFLLLFIIVVSSFRYYCCDYLHNYLVCICITISNIGAPLCILMIFYFIFSVLTIFTVNSLWYFYFIIELLWFVMLNLFFDYKYISNLISYFSFIVFNALIGIILLLNLSLSYVYGFIVVFLCKFGLLPLISLIFNYISYVSLVFLINYLFLKLSYFFIYLIISNNITCTYLYRELIVHFILLSLIVLFVLSVSVSLVSFNMYSLVSSTFNYFILLILYTISYNSIFPFLYILFYSYNSLILYYVIYMFVCMGFDRFNGSLQLLNNRKCGSALSQVIERSLLLSTSLCVDRNKHKYSPVLPIVYIDSINLIDMISSSLFFYIFYTSIFVFLLILAGVIPLFMFFLKLFYILFMSTVSIAFMFLLSFVVFFLFSYSFLNIILSLV